MAGCPAHGIDKAARSQVRREISQGFRWLWNNPAVRTLALTIVTFNVTFGAAWSVLVLYATERLGAGVVGFGLLTTATAVGGLVGTGGDDGAFLVSALARARPQNGLGERGRWMTEQVRPDDAAALDLDTLLRHGIAALSLGAGVLHASAAADHAGMPAHIAFFLGAAAVQSLLAALVVVRRTTSRYLLAAAVANGAIALVWAFSRTTGLPGVEGATAPETIGFKDGITTVLEIGVVAAAGLRAVLPPSGREQRLPAGRLASAGIMAAVWVFGIGGLLSGHQHQAGHQHGDGHGTGTAAGDHAAGDLAGAHAHAPVQIGTLAAHPEGDPSEHAHPAVAPLLDTGDPAHTSNDHGLAVTGPARSVAAGAAHPHGQDSPPAAPAGEDGHRHDPAVAPRGTAGADGGHEHGPQPADGHENKPGDGHEHEPGQGHEHEPGQGEEPGSDRLVEDVLGLAGVGQ